MIALATTRLDLTFLDREQCCSVAILGLLWPSGAPWSFVAALRIVWLPAP